MTQLQFAHWPWHNLNLNQRHMVIRVVSSIAWWVLTRAAQTLGASVVTISQSFYAQEESHIISLSSDHSYRCAWAIRDRNISEDNETDKKVHRVPFRTWKSAMLTIPLHNTTHWPPKLQRCFTQYAFYIERLSTCKYINSLLYLTYTWCSGYSAQLLAFVMQATHWVTSVQHSPWLTESERAPSSTLNGTVMNMKRKYTAGAYSFSTSSSRHLASSHAMSQ